MADAAFVSRRDTAFREFPPASAQLAVIIPFYGDLTVWVRKEQETGWQFPTSTRRSGETILEATRPYGNHVHEIFGGLHLVATPDAEIARIAGTLHDAWRLDLIAPGHCTGEPAFDALQRRFGDRYVYAGLGTVTDLP